MGERTRTPSERYGSRKSDPKHKRLPLEQGRKNVVEVKSLLSLSVFLSRGYTVLDVISTGPISRAVQK